MLSKWAPLKDELSESERQLASDVLCFLVERQTRERLDVFKFNLDIVKLIIEAWKRVLKVPTKVVSDYIVSEEKCIIGIHLTSVFLVNRLKVWNDNEEDTFLELLLNRLHSSNKAIFKPCGETVGLFLQYFDGDDYCTKVDRVMKKISDFDKYILSLEG